MYPEFVENQKVFPLKHVTPDIREWPINRLTLDKESFMKDIVDQTIDALSKKITSKERLKDVLSRVLYQEKIRLTQTPWKADRSDEKEFWGSIKNKILNYNAAASPDEAFDIREDGIVEAILTRYINEIVGEFDPGTYKFARSIIPHIFARLLNASPRRRRRKGLIGKRKSIHDKIKVYGNIDQIRNLSTKGTLIITPTHFSNLDSLVIGWVIETMGLPGFNYGAGLNLFGIKLIAYFMTKLGAYKLDRRKKNLFYLELLKSYSSVALQRGAHTLFFPGGTRSRSGKVETNLKLGLLGTALDAQRLIYKNFPEETARKIYIIPAILNYHFVLEAPALINTFLEREGKERFLAENDEFSTSYKFAKFIFKFLTQGSDMAVSFGTVLDVFGNEVDYEGNSISALGAPINIKNYFISNGQLSDDQQRDSVYTKMLGDKIVEKYFAYNIVFSSHLMAFAAFEILIKQHDGFDLYALLRLPAEDTTIEYSTFVQVVEKLRTRLRQMEENRQVQLSESLDLPVDELISHGLSNMGLYHAKAPLLKDRHGDITTEDMNVLYYYHNRLLGYNLEKHV